MPHRHELLRLLVMGFLSIVLCLGLKSSVLAQGEPAADSSKDKSKQQQQVSPGERDEEKLPVKTSTGPDTTEDRDIEAGDKELQAQKDNLFIQWLFVSVAIVLAIIAFAIWMSLPPGKKKGNNA